MAEEIIEQPGEGEKKFTQAEVDALIGKRLGEERKKYPTAEEMSAYNTWKQAQQTETEKLAGIIADRDNATKERDAAKAEAEQLRNEKYLLSKGIEEDDLEYYAFKISKNVSDSKSFAAAADEFLKDVDTTNKYVRMDTGANVGGGNGGKQNPNDVFNNILRRAAKR